MATIPAQPLHSLQVNKAHIEDPQTLPEKLTQLKTWIATQPHLPPFDDDARVTSFLRGCKFDMEKVRRKIDMYFSMRTAAPEVQILPLDNLTEDGCRVMWLCSTYPKIDIKSGPENIKLSLMIGDMRLALEQLAYPARLRQVHVINCNACVEYTLTLINPLIPEKIKDRIHYHGKDFMKTLPKFVAQELWPEDFGGNAGSIKDIRASWRKILEDHRDWFLDQETVKTDDTKRPGKPINYDELFGIVNRNFRKLNID
ncbi:hypothetical protein B566_EDAN007184 [Ephemera danica]|nr:hypothetical protein B566_EDAN007184 [Ephemera danica]